MDGSVVVVVVPDCGGEREDALQDADDHAAWGASAVLFQVEVGFEGGVDGFDDLSQGFEVAGAGAGLLAVAGLAQQLDPDAGQLGFEVAAEVAAIGDEDLSGRSCPQVGIVKDGQQGLPFVGFGAGQRVPDGQSAEGADQVQTQSPEVA